MDNKNIVHQRNRILYVEPNDIYGKVDGVPMTPDYSYYCISVNLIAEVVPRQKQSGGDSTKQYVLSMIMPPSVGDDGEPVVANNWVSFLKGEDAKLFGSRNENETFLTTYYTDIHYNDVLKKNIIEGLGIESVQVSFETYYTPTVVMKFVDVRGSSLFGREEVVHETGEDLTSSSVFGVFFTIPYPKFKLQIKGFYGHAVTYQLTCSDFKASFNSQTGNFEAVATFIGYSYSLLTDIPMRFLIAAPDCEYVGKDYWDKKVNSDEWRLSDGNTPPKLFDLMNRVKGLLVNTGEVKQMLMDDSDSTKKNNIENEKSLLNELSGALNAYIGALQSMEGTTYSPIISDNDGNEQFVIFCCNPKLKPVGAKLEFASNELIKWFDEYNSTFTERAFSQSLLPNGKKRVFSANSEFDFDEICTDVERDDANNIKKVVFNCESQSVEGLKSIRLNEKLSDKTAIELYKASTGNPASYFNTHCHVVNLNGFLKKINERKKKLNEENLEIDKKISQKLQTVVSEILHITPCIGDIFKIIMCHLETFIHMMWECYRIIQTQDRSPSALNIDLSKTDIYFPSNGKKEIYPWAGLFNNGKVTAEGGDIDEAINSIAWVGDLSDGFEEEKLVRELYKACQKADKVLKNDGKPLNTLNGLPVVPCDLNNIGDIFNLDIKSGISSTAGYLSLRAAQIFGVMMNEKPSAEMANAFGKMDAYNYFVCKRSRSDVRDNLLEPTSNKGSLSEIMTDVSHCNVNGDCFCGVTYNETDKSVHDFESAKAITNNGKTVQRHPMFMKNDHKSEYVHFTTENGVSLVPDRMRDYEKYKDTFDSYATNKNTYYTFKKKTDETNSDDMNGFVHKSNTRMLFDGLDNTKYDKDKYVNTDMFNVDLNNAAAVIEKYNELKSKNFEVLGDEYSDDFTTILEKFWHVENEDYGRFIGYYEHMLSLKTKDREIEEEELYPRNVSEARNNENAPKSIKNPKILDDPKDSGVKYDSAKDAWVCGDDEKPLSSLCVRFLRSHFLKNGGYGDETVFTSPFYYYQNNNVLIGSEDEAKMRERQKKVKALIFLHSLNYDYKEVAGFLASGKKNGGFYSMPYGYILLLGGLLWRKKYYDEYGDDPIQTTKNIGKACDYKEVGVDYTLFRGIGGRYVLCPLKESNGKDVRYAIKVSRLFGMDDRVPNWMPDQYVTNRLIELFENFVANEWSLVLQPGMELKRTFKTSDDIMNTVAFTGEKFSVAVKEFTDVYNISENTPVGGNPKNIAMLIYFRNQRFFDNFFGNYRFVDVNSDGGLRMLLDEDNDKVQYCLKDIYTRKVIVADMSGIRHVYDSDTDHDKANKKISIDTDTLKAYFSGFESKIKELSVETRATEVNKYGDDDTTYSPDLLLPIYLYLKMLWDKWLVSTTTKKYKNGKTVSYEDYYNVENFYNSFVFIDAFYKNIYKKFIINLETLNKAYFGRDDDSTLYHFIADVTKDHNCLFLALPDYVDMGNADNDKAVESMKNMFRPLPFNEMNGIDDENKFVVIYTPRMSEVPSSMNGYRDDYFKIWNPAVSKENEDGTYEYGDFDINGTKMFVEPLNDDKNDKVTRYGYYVPSFGVAFSRQNNHMFKNVNLNMTTPLATSASIAASANIAKMGAGSPHKAAFIGQDLYPVYSNYSYICEIEMMGNAQIQPLMYFQLMNIPMWSGVYMIFNVTHSISPGNMVTKFKGMKISRTPLPYNSSWYMFKPDNSAQDGYDEYVNEGGSTNVGTIRFDDGTITYSAMANYEIVYRDGEEPPTAFGTKMACRGVNEAEMKGYYIIRCMTSFINNGLTVDQAAGIVGNLMNEGLPCFAQKFAPDGPVRNGKVQARGKSFGLSQMYDKGAFPTYQKYCEDNGLDWRGVTPQLMFLYDVVKGRIPGYNKELKDTFSDPNTTYSKAAIDFARFYERCASCSDINSTTVQRRVSSALTAKEFYEKHKNNLGKGKFGTGKPVLVGDDWAVSMSKYFKSETGGVSFASSVKVNDVVTQIHNAFINGNVPKYVMVYYGSQYASEEDNNKIKDVFAKCCDAAGDIRVYICSLTYDNKNRDSDVRRINNNIAEVCSKHENAVYLKLDETEMNNFREKCMPSMVVTNPEVDYDTLFKMFYAKMPK